MGTNCSLCQVDVTQRSLAELKKRLEGDRRRVRNSPEVWVTIEELLPKEGVAITFSPLQFTLRDLEFKTLVEILGTPAELAQVACVQAAGKAMSSLKLSDDAKKAAGAVGTLGSKALAVGKSAIGSAMSKIGVEAPAVITRDTHKVKIIVTVDMLKDFGVEEVVVKLRNFKTSIAAFEMVLSSDRARSYIEEAISQKASEVATRMAKEKVQKTVDRAWASATAATGSVGLAGSGGSATS